MDVSRFIYLKINKSNFVLLLAILLFFGCQSKKGKSDIKIDFIQDTLNVGYTYWWPENGPFIGMCGTELSFVFTGIVKSLENESDVAGPLYRSQFGVIDIDQVFKIKDIGKKTYANQKYFRSDCFNDSGVQIGDRVLVLCYDYEGDYSIPGGKSILKLNSIDDPLLMSIRKYIDVDENPIKLKKDIGLWATQNLGRALEGIITCKEEMQENENTNNNSPE